MKQILPAQFTKVRMIFMIAVVPFVTLTGVAQSTSPVQSTGVAQGTTSAVPTETKITEPIVLNPFLVSELEKESGYMATASMAGSRTVQDIIDVPQTIDIVTRDEMTDLGILDTNEIMENLIPGVSSFTGEGVQGINALVNGFRTTGWSIDGAECNFLSEMVSDDFEDIEVIKGPAATLYGPAGAFGGYINMTMKDASRNPVNDLTFGVGSSGFYHGMADVGQALGTDGNFQYRLVLSDQDYNYPDRNYDYNRCNSIMPSIAYDFSKNSRLMVRFEYVRSNESWTPAVMGLNNQPLAFSPNEGGNAEPGGNRYLDSVRTLQAIFTTQMSDNWSWKTNFMIEMMSDDWNWGAMSPQTTTVAGESTPTAEYIFTPNRRVYNQKTWYGDSTLDWKRPDLPYGFSSDMYFDANVDYFTEQIKLLSNSMLASTPSLPNPLINPSNPNLSAMAFDDTYSGLEQYPYNAALVPGLSVSENLGVLHDRLIFVVRARYDYDVRTSELLVTTPANTPPPNSKLVGSPAALVTEEALTKDYGVVFKIMNGWTAYYGHSETYQPVATGTTYLGVPLGTETGTNDEVGTKCDVPLFGGVLTGTVSLFWADVFNVWEGDLLHPGFFVDSPPECNRGYNVDIKWARKGFSIVTGLYNADGPYGKAQPAIGIEPAGDVRAVYVPKVTANVWVKYDVPFLPHLSIGGGYHWQGNTVSLSHDMYVPGYGIGSAFAEYVIPFRKNYLKLQVNCTNIANTTGIYREDNVANVYLEEYRRTVASVSYVW